MSIQVTNLEAIGHLGCMRAKLIDDMSAFARKTSIPQAEKVANATARRHEMASIDRAIAALMHAEAHEIELKTPS